MNAKVRSRNIQLNITGIVASARPVLLLKTLALMWIGATFALQDFPDLIIFVEGFIIVGPLLWGGLYILNDVTDLRTDKFHPIKKERPLPSGKSSAAFFLAAAFILIWSAIILSFGMNLYFFLCVILMFVKQGLYTLPPFRFKERFLIDILSGSVFNSTLRFLTGWFLFSTSLDFPLLFLLSCEGLQVSGFMINRLYSNYTNDIEQILGYNSTVTKLSPKVFKAIAISLAALGFCSFLLLSLNKIFHFRPQLLGELPLEAFTVLMGLLVAIPLFLFPSLSRARSFSKVDLRRYNDLPIYLILLVSLYLSAIIKLYGK